ncbi:MAG: hypothetical protein Q8Q08_12880 [Candidatus Omnitrophota bacterium]|nr:hypothetical protein [Candidatus Omnitrophota bacterium]
MEILIGAAVAVATQISKKLVAKFGSEVTLLIVFAACAVLTIVLQAIENTTGGPGLIEAVARSFAASIATYEVVIKRVPGLGR